LADRNRTATHTHVEAIKQAAEYARRMSEMDRRRVAENLWDILTEAERRGIPKAQVLHASGHGSKEDSTKRLPLYGLDPQLPEQEKNRRVGHLVQTAKKYLGIAKQAALSLRLDEDHFVTKLFAGTSIGASLIAEDGAGTEDVYTELARLIRIAAWGIARKHNLARVFRDIEEHRLLRNDLTWRPACSPGFFSTNDDWGALWNGLVDGVRVEGIDSMDDRYSEISEPAEWDHHWILPYPNIRLGWTMPAIDGKPLSRLTAKTSDGEQVVLTATVVSEVRLAILPIGLDGSLEPAFITKLWTILILARDRLPVDRRIDELPYYLAWPGLPHDFEEYDNCPVLDDLGLTDLTIETPPYANAQEQLCIPLRGKEPALALSTGASSSGVRVDFVSPQSCRSLLRFVDAGESAGLGLAQEFKRRSRRGCPDLTVADNGEEPYDGFEPSWRTPDVSLARAVEKHFFAVPSNRRLDTLLDRECERVATEIDDFSTAH
jgi:hypothetical protein